MYQELLCFSKEKIHCECVKIYYPSNDDDFRAKGLKMCYCKNISNTYKLALTALSGYLAEEVKEQNIAVNLINPTGARTTGWEEKVAGRQARTGEPPRRAAKPEHVIPLALFLAEQEAKTGITGRAFDAMDWNVANGFGGWDIWTA
jgi:NAD(P)-dependent dehydrogenase (short-subunit alcohol dehydrogenase family)